jgi:carboxylesterase type B
LTRAALPSAGSRWTPALDNAKRPVLLWFHGGDFENALHRQALEE